MCEHMPRSKGKVKWFHLEWPINMTLRWQCYVLQISDVALCLPTEKHFSFWLLPCLWFCPRSTHSCSFSPQADFTTWSTPPSSPTMRRCKLVSTMVLRLPKWARYLLPGSFWAMTVVTPAGWRMAVSATLFLGQEGAAVLPRRQCVLWGSRIKSISCTGSIASEHTTECGLGRGSSQVRGNTWKVFCFCFCF